MHTLADQAPLTKERAPEAFSRLQSLSCDLTNVPDKAALTEEIMKARIEDEIVVVSFPQLQQRLGRTGVSQTTVHNRLKRLVRAGILSVDTTSPQHEFTLAVPLTPPVVSVETWDSELDSFIPTPWGDISQQFPTHGDEPTDNQTMFNLTTGQRAVSEQQGCRNSSLSDLVSNGSASFSPKLETDPSESGVNAES